MHQEGEKQSMNVSTVSDGIRHAHAKGLLCGQHSTKEIVFVEVTVNNL